MARIKNQDEASSITILSKNRRWARLRSLFAIARLSELFPENATPNGAHDDHLKCSGDVLSDLCMIGEELTKRGVTKEQMVDDVKRSFKPGFPVKHAEIRELLNEVKLSAATTNTKGKTDVESPVSSPTHSNLTAGAAATPHLISTDATSVANAMEAEVPEETGGTVYKSTELAGSDAAQKDEAIAINSPQESESDASIVVYQSIESDAAAQREHRVDDRARLLPDVFDQSRIRGIGRPKRHTTRRIARQPEEGIPAVSQGIQGKDGRGPANEKSVGVPSQGRRTATPTIYGTRNQSSLRSRDGGGPTNLRAGTQGGDRQAKSLKRKSAPGALETSHKRSRPDYTSSPTSFELKERDTLVSSLRMTHALLTAADEKVMERDTAGGRKILAIVMGMVEQVLNNYADE